jgi:radical SAM superfamily enzyme YgiQ (UPF0313 family)
LRVALVDCLAAGRVGRRLSSVDVIGSGPRLVVGILKSLGVEAELFECSDVVEGRVGLGGFDVLMVSGMSSDIASMVSTLRRWGGKGPAVAGGPACADYEELLRYGFTAVVWGEAELSLPKLVEGLTSGDLGSVPNVIYRDGGRVVSRVRPGYAVEPLLWSFQPDVESVRRYRYYWASRVYVEVVRGCSNFLRTTLPLPLLGGGRCTGCGVCRSGDLEARLACPLGIPPGCGYCLVPALYGPARSRPVDKVVEEVEGLVELGVRRVVLSAPDFLDYGRDWLVRPRPLTDPREPPANLDAIEELLNSLHSIGRVARGEVYVMVENVKPNLVTEEVAKLLGRYLRGTTVNVGLESGDPEHHVALGRPSTVEEVLRAVRLLREAGLRPYVYAIHGLPGESWRTVRNTIKVLRRAYRLGAERVVLYRFRPLRATAFEGYPEPRPGDPRGLALRRFVESLERRSKRRLLGEVIRVAVVGRHSREGCYIGYTLPHGPVAVVRSDEDLVGRVVDVRVVEVGTREVYGVPAGS